MIYRIERLDAFTNAEVVAPTEQELETGLAILLECLELKLRCGEFRPFLDETAYIKGSPLEGKSRLRYLFRGALGLALPRLNEYKNLALLRDRGFRAARPRFAAGVRRHGIPLYQLLATIRVQGARPLEEYCTDAPDSERFRLAVELGELAARLHEGGFIHRDLYPRNVLIDELGHAWLIDAWRGGTGRQLRGPLHDVACMLTRAPFDANQEHVLLESYFAGRKSVNAGRFLRRLPSERARLEQRAAREDERHRLKQSRK